MAKLEHHWTEKSAADFLYRIGADFIRQVESAMKIAGVNQAELAKRLRVSEGRVSQVLNNPGNVTLKKIVEYVRALGCKVAIVEYDDNDPDNRNGPVNSEIFAKCWYSAGMPSDFFALESAPANYMTFIIGSAGQPIITHTRVSRDNVANNGNLPIDFGRLANNGKTIPRAEDIDVAERGVSADA